MLEYRPMNPQSDSPENAEVFVWKNRSEKCISINLWPPSTATEFQIVQVIESVRDKQIIAFVWPLGRVPLDLIMVKV